MKNSIINECWKPVVGYEGLYEVSDLGKVRTLNYLGSSGKVKELKPRANRKGGYLFVTLCKDGKTKNFFVHRVVVTAFIGPIPAGMVVNHLNENKHDNRLANLEVITQKENSNYGTRNERLSKKLSLTLAKHPFAEHTFPSSVEASIFFGYKHKDTVSAYISKARQRGENFIKIRNEKYFFVQQSNEEVETLNKFSELTYN